MINYVVSGAYTYLYMKANEWWLAVILGSMEGKFFLLGHDLVSCYDLYCQILFLQSLLAGCFLFGLYSWFHDKP